MTFFQGFFDNKTVRALDAFDKQQFIDEAKRRLLQRNPNSEADDYEALISYAEKKPIWNQWLGDKSLESAWMNCLSDFPIMDQEGHCFYPMPQFSIAPYHQVRANVLFFEATYQMQAMNVDEPHRAWSHNIALNLRKASASGSYQATFLCHRHELECLMELEDLKEIEAQALKLAAVVNGDTLAMHGTPAFLLLAETQYVLSLKNSVDRPEFANLLRLEVLKLLNLAYKLEAYSEESIHNAYLGKNLSKAFQLQVVTARSIPVEFQTWEQFLQRIAKVLFPDLELKQIQQIVENHRSPTQEFYDRFKAQWEARQPLRLDSDSTRDFACGS